MEWGKKRLAIAEGYIPEGSTGPAPEMLSHETMCILNPNEKDAEVTINIFFESRQPLGPFKEIVGAKRTRHIRFNDLTNPGKIPIGIDYACTIESTTPVIVQHTRLDSRQSENALMTTIAHSE